MDAFINQYLIYDGAVVTACTGDTKSTILAAKSAVTVTGDVGILTATAGTVRINGNVGNYTQESTGSPIVEITGNPRD